MINPNAAAFTNPIVMEFNDNKESYGEFEKRCEKMSEYMKANSTITIRAYMATKLLGNMLSKSSSFCIHEDSYVKRAVELTDLLINKLNESEGQ